MVFTGLIYKVLINVSDDRFLNYYQSHWLKTIYEVCLKSYINHYFPNRSNSSLMGVREVRISTSNY